MDNDIKEEFRREAIEATVKRIVAEDRTCRDQGIAQRGNRVDFAMVVLLICFSK